MSDAHTTKPVDLPVPIAAAEAPIPPTLNYLSTSPVATDAFLHIDHTSTTLQLTIPSSHPGLQGVLAGFPDHPTIPHARIAMLSLNNGSHTWKSVRDGLNTNTKTTPIDNWSVFNSRLESTTSLTLNPAGHYVTSYPFPEILPVSFRIFPVVIAPAENYTALHIDGNRIYPYESTLDGISVGAMCDEQETIAVMRDVGGMPRRILESHFLTLRKAMDDLLSIGIDDEDDEEQEELKRLKPSRLIVMNKHPEEDFGGVPVMRVISSVLDVAISTLEVVGHVSDEATTSTEADSEEIFVLTKVATPEQGEMVESYKRLISVCRMCEEFIIENALADMEDAKAATAVENKEEVTEV